MMDLILPCYLVSEELVTLTKEAIASFGDVRLIVIDNASPLGGGYLRSVADVYVRNTHNVGYGKAVNQGLKLSGEGLVAIANNDVRLSSNWQHVTREVFSENDKTFSCHFRMLNYHEPFSFGSSTVYTGKERWCTGSFFVINNVTTPLYDEQFFNSYDDWDFFMTARKAGLYTAYTDKACYQHNHSTTQRALPEREVYNQENREKFKAKWGKYAEELFEDMYPEQMSQDYWKGFLL